MKAITLPQPFASLVAVGAKSLVTRPMPTSYRGPLGIHAAGTMVTTIDPFHRSVLATAGLDINNLPLGVVIAECRLVDCWQITAARCPCYPEYAFSDFRPGWFAWSLSDVRACIAPFPAKGHWG